eukprot:TRINITY_DN4273_c0_g5_i3.p1 TRINITY_DN4273_c0_g5~~TRINITY_DN4273_c0_g5_i3.p1  ORF type:complete len:598 (+),score=145.78 TRINITY_DN4273_c0_g5_i3:692-2485(+)
MLELNELEKAFDNLTPDQFKQAIQEGEKKELIMLSKRQLGTRTSQTFVSLRVKVISLDCVQWILKSLERDAMTPVEKAVQSRFKESFAVKMGVCEWNKLLEVLRNPKLVVKDGKKSEYEFDVIEIYDTISDSKTYSIYPKGHRWLSFDMALKPSDIDQELFKEFVSFLEFYFLDEGDKTRLEDRCIPGGRYGCAQFIKACGTPALRACSLGQLSQFIQFAINQHMLRHQRTLLVWNTAPLKTRGHEVFSSDSEAVRKEKERLKHKMNVVKQAVLELLAEKPSGLPLAQLPQHLKYRLPFPLDLNELGFLKLKELLATMADQVKVDARGHNYPIARLIHKKSMGGMHPRSYGLDSGSFDKGQRHVPKRPEDMHLTAESFGKFSSFDFNRHLDLVRNCLYALLQEYPLGIDCTKIPLLIYMKAGIEFNFYHFGCSSLSEFLQKYVISYYELEFISINPYDPTCFLVRLKSNAPMANYYSMQQYVPGCYPVHYRFETDPNALSGNSFASTADHFPYAPAENKSVSASMSEPTFPSSGNSPAAISLIVHSPHQAAAGDLARAVREGTGKGLCERSKTCAATRCREWSRHPSRRRPGQGRRQ